MDVDLPADMPSPSLLLQAVAGGYLLSKNDTQLVNASILHVDYLLEDSETKLGRLLARKKYLTDRAVVAPIHRLPNDVLGFLFQTCIEMDRQQDSRCKDILPQSYPLLLLQVCRRWRNVTLQHQAFFSSISLSSYSTLNPFMIFPLWLARSYPLPVDLCFDFDMPCFNKMVTEQPCDSIKGFWSLIKNSLSRSRSIRILGISSPS